MKVRKLSGAGGQQTSKFYAVFANAAGQLCRVPLFKDRRASEEAGRKIGQLLDIKAAGDTLPPELSRWIEAQPPHMLERLVSAAVIDAKRTAASKPLTEHLAEWRDSLIAKGTTTKQADQVRSRAAAVFTNCGFVFWSDIVGSVVGDTLAKMQEGEGGISAQTYTFYVQAVKQFCRWMVSDRRASESPLSHLKGKNAKTDRRHDRRVLTPEEVARLLTATEKATTRAGVTGQERATIYRRALSSGLRANEIRTLRRESFNLNPDAPTVTVAAAYAKNRRETVQPLPVELVSVLSTHLAGKMPAAAAFQMLKPNMIARVLRSDLAAARAEWLAESATPEERSEGEKTTFLAYRDAARRVADFHAFRHTYISNLVSGGVHPKTAQELARHQTMALTMERYTHVYRGQLSQALSVLPSLALPAADAATGTDGGLKKRGVKGSRFLSPPLSPESAARKGSEESGGVLAEVAAKVSPNEKPRQTRGLPGSNGEIGIL